MERAGKTKKLPVGIESFEKIRREGFYYVDKSAMIRDLLDKWGEVNLFTRPRRFGKSLNMSMLKSFFEVGCDRSLFDGLQISEEPELCGEYMGRFPVIFISLKGIHGNDYTAARAMICSVIGNEAMRFQFLLDSARLTDKEKKLYDQLTAVDETNQEVFSMPDAVLTGSLKMLAGLLLLLLAQAVFLPAAMIFLGQGLEALPLAGAVSLALVDVGMCALGSLLGALAQGQSGRESLLGVILFPLLTPLLLAGIGVGAQCLGAPAPDGPRAWLGLAAAFDAVFLGAGLVLFGFLYPGED